MTGSIQVSHGMLYMVFNTYVDGKRKPTWEATGLKEKGNRKKAREMLNQRLATWDRDHKEGEPTSDILFSEWIKKWLEYTKPNVRISTYEGYELHSRHVIDYFSSKGYKLKDLKSIHFEEYYNFMLIKGKKNSRTGEESGLSIRTVRSHKFIINAALDKAVINELLTSNPARLVKVTNKRNRDLAKPIEFFSASQANQFIEFINQKDDVLADLIFVTLYYGLRRSEVLGLTMSAVDLTEKKLHIKKTIVKLSNTHNQNKTKTKASEVSIDITDETIPFFQEVFLKKEKNKEFFGKEYHDSDYLFTWQDGHLFSPDYVYHHFKDLVTEFGRPQMTFHGLRHSCASILYEKGWSPKDIQIWLRHADFYTTMNIYTHIDNFLNHKRSQNIQGILKIPYSKDSEC